MKKLCIIVILSMNLIRQMAADDKVLLQQIKKIEKAELHLHLGGSWPLEFLKTIADSESFAKLTVMLDRMEEGMEYEQAFAIFDLVGKMVNTDQKVEDGAIALCKQLIDDNVAYVEIRTGLKDLGSGIEGYLQALLRGIKKGCANSSLTAKIILSVRRDSSSKVVQQTIDYIKKYRNQGVIGLDISGVSIQGDGAAILQAADLIKENNIPITLHLGESPQETAVQQMKELLALKPTRIGHGVYLCKQAFEWICSNKIPIELCLTSAMKVGMIHEFKDHPALSLLAFNYPIIICTDDPLIFRTTLSQECARVAEINALNIDDMIQLQKKARKFAFLSNAA